MNESEVKGTKKQKQVNGSSGFLNTLELLLKVIQRLGFIFIVLYLMISFWPVFNKAAEEFKEKTLHLDTVEIGPLKFSATAPEKLNNALNKLEKTVIQEPKNQASDTAVSNKSRLVLEAIEEIRQVKEQLQIVGKSSVGVKNMEQINNNKYEQKTSEYYWTYLGLAKNESMVKSQNFKITVLPSVGDIIIAKTGVYKRDASPKYREEEGWIFGAPIGVLRGGNKVEVMEFDKIPYGDESEGILAVWAYVKDIKL
jgi:hypothetical protein